MAQIELSPRDVERLSKGENLQVSHPNLGRSGINGSVFIRVGSDEHGLTDVEVVDDD